jgi:type I restriction enzyme, S subunit
MAGEWETAPLDSLIEPNRAISYGIVQPGALVADGVPIVRVSDVRDGRIAVSTPLRVAPAIEATYVRTRLVGGELLLTLVGTVGESAVVPTSLAGWNVARAVAVIPVRKEIGAYWVKLALGAPGVRDIIESRLNTTVQATLNLGDVAKLPIVLPPVRERGAIACILGTLDDKIELNRRMNETLEAMARALFKSWFVDFDPVRAKAAGRDAGLPQPLADLFPDSFEESELGEIPRGWRVSVLSDVLSELETGGRPKGGVSGYASGTPSIGAESITGLGVFDYSRTKYVPDEFFDRMTKGHVKSRDVLLYKDGGRPGEFEPHLTLFGDGFPFDTCAINEHVYRMRAKKELGQSFLFFWLSSDLALEEMRIKGTGVAIPGLNSTQVKSLTTLVPTSDIALAFDRLVGPWITRVLAGCNESRTLATLREALLPRLLSGELRLPASTMERAHA